MSKWEKVKLDNICVKKIQTISPKGDSVSYQTIKSQEAPSREKQILSKEDILVSTVRPNLNAIAVNRIESENVVVGSTGYCVLRCGDNTDVNYVFNFCKSKTFINGR